MDTPSPDNDVVTMPDPELDSNWADEYAESLKRRKLRGKGITRPNWKSRAERRRARKRQRQARKVTRARAK